MLSVQSDAPPRSGFLGQGRLLDQSNSDSLGRPHERYFGFFEKLDFFVNCRIIVFLYTFFSSLQNHEYHLLSCYKNLPEVVETDEDDNEAFRSAMNMLDQIAAFKRDTPGFEFK